MEGVTVLNIIPAFNSIIITIILSIIFIISVIILGFIFSEYDFSKQLYISLIISCLIGLGFLISIFIPSQTERYEVSISDDVTFNEFIEKYKIIEERGQIFIVEERKNSNDTDT